jgi:hypothetical protein
MILSRLDRSLMLSQRGPFLSPPEGETGGSAEAAKADSSEKADSAGAEKAFTPITSEAELTAYKVDLRKNIKAELDAELRKSIKAELDAQRIKDEDAARKQKDLDDATARGEFEDVKTKLETDLKTATDDVTRMTAEITQLQDALKSGLTEGWAALPETVRKLGERQHGENDVIGRFTFLHDADTQALVKELTKGDGAAGNGRDPKPGGEGQLSDEAKRKAQAPIYTRF